MSAVVVMVLMVLGCSLVDPEGDALCGAGSLGYEPILNTDEAGVTDVGQGVTVVRQTREEVVELRAESWNSEGASSSYLAEFDGAGNTTLVEYTALSATGEETVFAQSVSYEGGRWVRSTVREAVDGEATLDYELSLRYNDAGLMATFDYVDPLKQFSQYSEYFYDNRDREVLVQREGSSLGGCYEWATVYDDSLNTQTAFTGVGCGKELPETWSERRTYDREGHLLFIETDGQTRAWTWVGDDPSTYTAASGSTRVFQIEDGVLVGATGQEELGDWLAEYDSSGRIQEVSFYSTGEVKVHNGFRASFSELAGDFLSGYTRSVDGEASFTAAYEFNDLGNLIGRSWEDLVSGVSGQVDYSVVCEER